MKGLLQSLEAVIGVVTIFTILILFYSGKDPIPEFDTINFKVRGFQALKALDDQNRLRDAALANDTASLKSRLSGILPAQMNFDVVVCTTNCIDPNIASDKVTSVAYLIAGNVDDFRYRQIILYMW